MNDFWTKYELEKMQKNTPSKGGCQGLSLGTYYEKVYEITLLHLFSLVSSSDYSI